METVPAAVWARTLLAVALVSGLSLVGAGALLLRRETLNRALFLLISFAAGALLGDAFLHIVPEIAESETGFDLTASFSLLGGVLGFFVLEKVLHWHHSHLPHEEVLHPVAVSNLVGDSLHNFVDGAIVAGAFISSTELGVATAIAVALHEIPQEMGDLGILIHAGLKPRRALALNFLTALAAIAGGVLTLLFASLAGVERYLLPFTAGAFVYIASTDLFPELHKEPEPIKSAVQVLAILAGVAVLAALLVLE
jgi:zinc and cadmium transporter